MKDLLLALFIAVVIALPVAHVYAIVSTCGWKGLFVECRITEIQK